jgi:hypothetical protein
MSTRIKILEQGVERFEKCEERNRNIGIVLWKKKMKGNTEKLTSFENIKKRDSRISNPTKGEREFEQ